jgi:hypothetical protein
MYKSACFCWLNLNLLIPATSSAQKKHRQNCLGRRHGSLLHDIFPGHGCHGPKKYRYQWTQRFLFSVFTIYIWLVVYLPLWKIWKSVGIMTFPIYGKIKHVPNHQPAMELGLGGHPQWNYGKVFHWIRSMYGILNGVMIVDMPSTMDNRGYQNLWFTQSWCLSPQSCFFQICVSFLPSCLPSCSIVGICSSYAFSCFSWCICICSGCGLNAA